MKANLLFVFNQSPTILYAVVFIILAGIAVGWYVFCYSIFEHKNNALIINREQLKKGEQSLQKRLGRFASLIQQAEDIKQEIAAITHELKQNARAVLEKVLVLIKQHALELESITEGKRERCDLLHVSPYQMNFSGTYDNIVRFFKDLDVLKPALSCTACTIKKMDGQLICLITLNFLEKSSP